MKYNLGDKIKIDGKSYTIVDYCADYYKIKLNNKHGLADKVNCKIAVEPIYDCIWEYSNHYEIELNNKHGLIDKVTYKIAVEPIYDCIWEYNNYYIIILNDKYGLMDKVNYKVILNPEYTNTSYEDLVKIYEELLKSKMRIEKLRQLEEML
jgi:hypothetical protein